MNSKQSHWRIAPFVLVGLIMFAVGRGVETPTVQAENRPTAPQATFLSGSERSLEILHTIAKHVASIDHRLERMEQKQNQIQP